jgi:hypothetical protein
MSPVFTPGGFWEFARKMRNEQINAVLVIVDR